MRNQGYSEKFIKIIVGLSYNMVDELKEEINE